MPAGAIHMPSRVGAVLLLRRCPLRFFTVRVASIRTARSTCVTFVFRFFLFPFWLNSFGTYKGAPCVFRRTTKVQLSSPSSKVQFPQLFQKLLLIENLLVSA